MRQLHALLRQCGLTEEEAKAFGLRSFRSGAAGQASINLASRKGGVPTTSFLEAIARMLGHVSLSRVTLDAYIGLLAKLIFDNGAVLHLEEEGIVGSHVDFEARIASIPVYAKIAKSRMMEAGEREKEAESRAVQHHPNLPPAIEALVDADPVVAASQKVMAVEVAECRRAWSRERQIKAAGGTKDAPLGLFAESHRRDRDLLYASIGRSIDVHNIVRQKALRRIMREAVAKMDPNAQGFPALKFSPHLLFSSVNILHAYGDKRKTACK